MSSPSDREGASSSGLGHSTPLVTVQPSPFHGSGIRPSASGSLANSRRVATTNTTATHPLTVVPGVDVTTSNVELSDRAPVPPPPATPTVVALPPPPVPVSPPNPTTTSATMSPPSMKSPTSSTSLDALADTFLSGPSARTTDQRPPLFRPAPLPKGEKGLKRLHTLVERRAWGDVLQVTGEMLRGPSSPHWPVFASLIDDNSTPLDEDPESEALKQETVEILTLECHAWLKLRRYADLGREIKQWNFLSFNNPEAVSPSWIPWGLHILAAETLQYTDPTPKRCVDVLNTLREDLTKEENGEIWLGCVDHALSNAFIRQEEWRLALATLDNLFESLPEATKKAVNAQWVESGAKEEERDWVCSRLLASYRCEVLSRQGRIMLQAGALQEASILFEEAKTEWSASKSMSSKIPPGVSEEMRRKVDEYLVFRHVDAQLSINDGLLCFAHSDYDSAMSFFSTAIDQQRSLHASGLNPTYCSEDWIGPAVVGVHSSQSVMTDACNNMALCALCTCRMHEAVRMIESLIREDPTAFLTEGLAFNLCTLYELGAEQPASARKKRVLQLIAKRFFLHDIGPESFRLN